MEKLEPFDIVALTSSDLASKVTPGLDGTVLQVMRDGRFEVEFSDDEGRTLHVGYYAASDLRRIWSGRTQKYVPSREFLHAPGTS